MSQLVLCDGVLDGGREREEGAVLYLFLPSFNTPSQNKLGHVLEAT